MEAKIPPHNLEAEAIVLGGAILFPSIIADLRVMIHPDDFYREVHRVVYHAICDLHDRKHPVEAPSLCEWLKRKQQLEFVGGWSFIRQLIESASTTGMAKHYAQMVREKSQRRKLIIAAREIENDAYDELTEVPRLQALAEEKILATKTTTTVGARDLYDIGLSVRTRLAQELSSGVSAGFRSGWYQLNRILAPIQPGQMIVVGARPGMGKTAFATNWALALGEQGLPGVVYSMEMDEEEITLRALLQYMQTTNSTLQNPSGCADVSADILSDADSALERLLHCGVKLNDTSSMTIDSIREELRQLNRERHQEWVMVDFLQLASSGKRSRSRQEEVGDIAYGLAEIAKDFKCAVIALSQLSREVDKESPRRPRKDHFLESGKIEAAAHRMLYLYRPSEYGDAECNAAGYPVDMPELTEVGIIKQRNSKSFARTLLFFDGDHYKFRDLYQSERQRIGQAEGQQ